MNPFHQLRPGVMPRWSPLLVLIEHLDLEQRQVRLCVAVWAGPSKGDDPVSVGGSRSETSVIDDEVFLGPGHEGCKPLEKLVGGEDEMCGAVVIRSAEPELDPAVVETREPRLGKGRPELVSDQGLEGATVRCGERSTCMEIEAIDVSRALSLSGGNVGRECREFQDRFSCPLSGGDA